MRNIIILVFFYSLNAGAQSWTNQIGNKNLQWKAGGLVNLPTGYTADLKSGVVFSDLYYLKIEKSGAGKVISVSESVRSPVAGDAEKNIKSADTFEVKRILFSDDGSVQAKTDCSGSRTLSTSWGMMTSMLKLSWGGNKRAVSCRTTTPQMCEILRKELKAFGNNHNIQQYAEACQAYAKDMGKVFTKVVSGLPVGLLNKEKAQAEIFFKLASQGGNLDYSSVNLSLVLSEMSPEERIKNLNTGMIMFNELIEIEKACDPAGKVVKTKTDGVKDGVGSSTAG